MKYFISLLCLLVATPAYAWNALGHRIIAYIAWQEVSPEVRKSVVDTLRRHPRFDEDFAKQVPPDADEDLWLFGQAAVWPDIARGFQGEDLNTYNHGTWHYVNHPLFVGGERPLLGVNLSAEYPPLEEQSKWNVIQAVKHCQATLKGDASPSDKALAYCWLFHLIGDLHQPLHSTALFSERFPTGDRGGNLIPVVQGGNLHSLWDGLLGRRDRPNDVEREVAELRELHEAWKVETDVGVEEWIQESHELAKSFAYSSEIIAAVEREGELERINLPEDYLETAGNRARARIVAAGLRLASMINNSDQTAED